MTTEVERVSLRQLRDRGVTNPDEFAHLDDAVIVDTTQWFDDESRRRQIGVGVLVAELRKGGRRPQQRRDLIAESAEYGRSMHAWVRQHMPDLVVDGYAHPAAIAALIRLHKRHGKGSVTVREHGLWIREFVSDWKARVLGESS